MSAWLYNKLGVIWSPLHYLLRSNTSLFADHESTKLIPERREIKVPILGHVLSLSFWALLLLRFWNIWTFNMENIRLYIYMYCLFNICIPDVSWHNSHVRAQETETRTLKLLEPNEKVLFTILQTTTRIPETWKVDKDRARAMRHNWQMKVRWHTNPRWFVNFLSRYLQILRSHLTNGRGASVWCVLPAHKHCRVRNYLTVLYDKRVSENYVLKDQSNKNDED